MPGRKFDAGSSYRYGFNGKENDVKDGIVQYDYGFRIYDPRLGKFKSVDPLQKKFPELTPYQFASNSPIASVDLDGREAQYYVTTINYITTYRTSNDGITTVESTQETLFDKQIPIPNNTLRAGTMRIIATQVIERYYAANGDVSQCIEPRKVVQRIYEPTELEIKKWDLSKRPMSSSSIQIQIYGSAYDNSESPGDQLNPNVPLISIDMGVWNDVFEPILLGMDIKNPEAPQLSELLGEYAAQKFEEYSKKNEQAPPNTEKIIEDNLTYNPTIGSTNPVNQRKVTYGQDGKPKDTITIWNQDVFGGTKKSDTTPVVKKSEAH